MSLGHSLFLPDHASPTGMCAAARGRASCPAPIPAGDSRPVRGVAPWMRPHCHASKIRSPDTGGTVPDPTGAVRRRISLLLAVGLCVLVVACTAAEVGPVVVQAVNTLVMLSLFTCGAVHTIICTETLLSFSTCLGPHRGDQTLSVCAGTSYRAVQL